MGYYANGSGYITLTERPNAETMSNLEYVFYITEMAPKDGLLTLDIYNDDKYFGEDVQQALNAIAPITKEGSIRYFGKDDSIWEFYFDPERKQWIEENAEVLWPSEQARLTEVVS